MNVGVHDPHVESVPRQSHGEVGCDRAFPNAALAAHHHDPMPDEGQFRFQPFLSMSLFLLLAARGRFIARFTRCFVVTFFVGHLFSPPVWFLIPSTVLCFVPSFLLDFGCPRRSFSPTAQTSLPPAIAAKAGSEPSPQEETKGDVRLSSNILDDINPVALELSKAEVIDA